MEGEQMLTTKPSNGKSLSVFSDKGMFEDAQRMAKVLVASQIVPKSFQGPEKLPDAIIAIEMAQRIGASPIAVMQNLYIVHGKPSWSASFIAAAIAASGRFSPIRYRMSGTANQGDRTCVAWAYDDTGEKLEGPPVSIDMATKEGWATKSGSKWKTMPELMLRYRAITFFGRLYAPDILMGMRTDQEANDIGAQKEVDITPIDPVDLNEPAAIEEEEKPKTAPKKNGVDWASFTQNETQIRLKMKNGKAWEGCFVGVAGNELAVNTKDGLETLPLNNVDLGSVATV